MEKDNLVPEAAVSALSEMEDHMEPIAEPITAQPASHTPILHGCTHSRAIDDVLTRGKKRTGKVRCLECGAVFDDPHLKLES